MKKTLYLYLSILLIAIISCNNNSVLQQLEVIDNHASQESNEKVMSRLNAIAPETIDDEESLAYYWLLKIRTEIRLRKQIQSTEPLEISIKYYKNHHDKGKLARAYGYKATILDNLGDYKGAILALKEAERLMKDDTHEVKLIHYIYQTLAYINQKAKENDLALEYSKLALKTAYQLKDQYEIAYSLMSMFVSYNDINKNDSASYYLNQIIPYIEKLPKYERVSFYDNIGLIYTNNDISLAEKYLKKAYDIQPDAYTYKGLARIYYKRGERQRAKEMWQKALQTDNRYLKVEILQAMYDSQQEEGDYKTASETAMKIAALKDSIAQKEKKDDIRGLQQRFDNDLQREHERARLSTILFLAALILLIVTVIIIYLYKRSKKERKELLNTQQQLEGYRNQLKILQKEGKTDTKEVERLTQKISELQAKQGAQIQNGRERYEEVAAGGTTVRWSRNDFNDCIEYCRTLDAAFITHMEQDYNHLSAKYILFAFMEQQGKSDEELQHIMAISQNTVRSYRSRIHSAASHHHELI